MLGCLFACCLLVWLLYISIHWLLWPPGWTFIPSTLRVASALGSLQNPLKMNFQNRRPKGVQDDIQGSQNHCKLMKNRAQGPPDPIFDVILSIFVFEGQYNEFDGFSGSWGTLKDNKSTRIACDNHIGTMHRQNIIQSTFCIKNDVVCPLKLDTKSYPPTSPRASSVWDAIPSAHQPIQLINPGLLDRSFQASILRSYSIIRGWTPMPQAATVGHRAPQDVPASWPRNLRNHENR